MIMPNLCKCILLIWAVFGWRQLIQAQSLKQSVIATSGGSSNAISGYSIDFTVGETVIKTGSASSVVSAFGMACTQGFQQPFIQKDFPAAALTLQATASNTHIQLEWTTATETNNDVFYIEHSNDGITYTVIGQLPTKAVDGNSTSPLHYGFTHLQPVSGNNYYRLRQVSKTTLISYSNTVIIPFVLPEWNAHVYPNPFQNIIRIKLYTREKGDFTLRLMNMMGQLLLTQRFIAEKGYNDFRLNTTSLKAGMYVLFIHDHTYADHHQTIKLIKQ